MKNGQVKQAREKLGELLDDLDFEIGGADELLEKGRIKQTRKQLAALPDKLAKRLKQIDEILEKTEKRGTRMVKCRCGAETTTDDTVRGGLRCKECEAPAWRCDCDEEKGD